MKEKIKGFLNTAKDWSWVDWVINFRFIGYALLLLKGLQDNNISIPELIIFGGVIGLMERKAKQIHK
jgi:hypothetical protein